MTLSLPPCPQSLKAIQHFLKIASEHETRDPVVSYWARLTALQSGMKLDKSSKEALAVLLPLMDWLEQEKGNHPDNEAVSNEVFNYHVISVGWLGKALNKVISITLGYEPP